MRSPKTIRRALLFVIAVEIGYMIAATAFLNSPVLLNLINGDTDDLKIGRTWAFSPLPGLVVVRDFTFRLQDPNIQMFFTIPHLSAWIVPWALPDRILELAGAEGEGLHFALRLRRTDKELRTTDLAALPPIPGLDVRRSQEPTRPPPQVPPWRVRVDSLRVAKLTTVWIDEFRYEGGGELEGNFFVRPSEGAEVPQARLHLGEGAVHRGKMRAIDLKTMDLGCRVARFNQDQVEDSRIFRFISADIGVEGNIESAQFLNPYLKALGAVRVDRGSGPLRITAKVADGRLVPPTRLMLRANDLSLNLWEQHVVGDAEVVGSVRGKNRSTMGTLRFQLPRFRLTHRRNPDVALKGSRLSLAASTKDLDLVDPFTHEILELFAPTMRVDDIRYFQSYLPKGSKIRLHHGGATLHAWLRIAPGQKYEDRGWLDLKSERLEVWAGSSLHSGKVTLNAKMTKGDVGKGDFDLSGSRLRLEELSPDPNIAPAKGWWFQCFFPEARLHFGDKLRLTARTRLSAKDARPLMQILGQKLGLPGIAQDLLVLDNLRGTAAIASNEHGFSISDASIAGGESQIQGWFFDDSIDRLGRVLVSYGPLEVGLGFSGKQLTVRLENAKRWFHNRDLKIGLPPQLAE